MLAHKVLNICGDQKRQRARIKLTRNQNRQCYTVIHFSLFRCASVILSKRLSRVGNFGFAHVIRQGSIKHHQLD